MYAVVKSAHRITPGLIRIVFGDGDLETFEPTSFTDQYINGYFLPTNAPYSIPFDLGEARKMGEKFKPRPRRVTVRKWDDKNKQLTVDFVLHGQSGYAGPWAQRAQPGDKLQFKGPNGGYAPDPDVDWHLLAGDETALPAISASVESLGPDANCVVFLVVNNKSFEVPINTQAKLELVWLHRETSTDPKNILLNALTNHSFRAGTFDVFVHGEAGEVRSLRKYLLSEHSVDPESSISPYWRRHHTDEAWRAVKRDWLDDQENDI